MNNLEFFRSKSGNWVCPTDSGLIVGNGKLSPAELKAELEKGSARRVGENILVGFGSETAAITIGKAIEVKKSVTVSVTIKEVE